MDRYVNKDSRAGATEYPQDNQLHGFSSLGNNVVPAREFHGNYAAEYPNMQLVNNGAGFMGVVHVNTPTLTANNYQYGQDHVVSGIDSSYLAGFSTNNAAYIATGQQASRQFPVANTGHSEFGAVYQNRNVLGIDRSNYVTNTGLNQYPSGQQASRQFPVANSGHSKFGAVYQNRKVLEIDRSNNVINTGLNQFPSEQQIVETWKPKDCNTFENKKIKSDIESSDQQQVFKAPNEKTAENVSKKNEVQLPTMTRSEKLKALYKSGPRAFSGPIEKVLKWHKALQDIGILVIYEIVAKCMNVRAGEGYAKILLLRNENGPVMLVDFYEIDFYLPELKPNCTVRVIGRMIPGTNRLQAFNVRLATADDVTMLTRRAAVASHHVAKLCKEYGTNTTNQ